MIILLEISKSLPVLTSLVVNYFVRSSWILHNSWVYKLSKLWIEMNQIVERWGGFLQFCSFFRKNNCFSIESKDKVKSLSERPKFVTFCRVKYSVDILWCCSFWAQFFSNAAHFGVFWKKLRSILVKLWLNTFEAAPSWNFHSSKN